MKRQDLLTIEETCEYIQMCRSTLRKKEKEGHIKPVYWLGRKMFSREDLDRVDLY